MDNLQIRTDIAFNDILKNQFESFMTQLEKDIGSYFQDILSIEKSQFTIGVPSNSWIECLSEGLSFAAPLKVSLKFTDGEKDLHICNIPLLTPRGTFIIEGQERIAKKVLKATDTSKSKKERKHLSPGEKSRDLRFYKLEVVDFYNVLLKLLTKIISKARRSKYLDFPYFAGGTDLYLNIFNSKFGIEHFPFLDSTNPLSEVEHNRKLAFVRGERTGDGRDIHPTHYGRLCVVETPESEKIGMRVHLAHKAKIENGRILSPSKIVDNHKVIYISPEQDSLTADNLTELSGSVLVRDIDGDGKYVDALKVKYKDAFDDELFGYAALQVPFIQHNDSARALMGAKNLKQAVPLREPEIPIIKTGYEETVAELSGRIIKAEKGGKVIKATSQEIVIASDKSDKEEIKYSIIRSIPSVLSKTAFFQRPTVAINASVETGQAIAEGAGIKDGTLALGVNALVAYMPFFGYNMDDGLVVSDRLAEKLSSVHIEVFEIKIKPGYIPKWIAYEGLAIQTYSGGIQLKGLEDMGRLTRTPVAILKRTENRKTEEITIFAKEEMLGGVIRKTFVEPDRIRFWIQRDKKLEVGDKLMGRHGNKGIVAKILPLREMPSFQIKINGTMQQRYIDLLLNPHSVITRMNIGQIYETHFGWIAKEHPNDTVRSEAGKMGKPFSRVNKANLVQWFEQSGLNSEGKIKVKFADGNETVNPVVVGYQYIVKLNHLASSKLSIRGDAGPVSFVTDLPLSGKKRAGGQRLGEMEVWALLAHGANEILRDMLGNKSNAHLLANDAVSISESLKAFVYYLRGLGIALDIFDKEGNLIQAEQFDKTRRSEVKKFAVRWAETSEMMNWGCHWNVPEKKSNESLKDYYKRKKTEEGIRSGAKKITSLGDLEPDFKEQMGYISLAEKVLLCDREIDVLPVIPLRCRPLSSSKLSKLYGRIYLTNNKLYELKREGQDDTENYTKNKTLMQKNVNRLEEELESLIKGKRGIIRKAILGKRVNFSARAVIVPDPNINADSALIPLKIMHALNIKAPVTVKTAEGEKLKYEKVLLNRQPTLHIHNIQAFDALPAGYNAIAINPLVCGGFNADFDGDTMAVYRTDKPIPNGMLVAENIFLASNGKLNLNFSQDILAGIYYASGTEEGQLEFTNLIDDEDIFDVGKIGGPIGKNTVSSIVHKHFLKYNDRVKTLRLSERIAKFGLEWATLSGLTFGIFDLYKLAIEPDKKKELNYDVIKIEQTLQGKVNENLTNPISIMMLSEARGDIEQLRQMAGIKGFVDRIGGKTTSVSVNSSYLDGLKPIEYYLSCFGARNSITHKKLMTPKCGYLTRRLVFSAFDTVISEDDCKTQVGVTVAVDWSFGRTLLRDIRLNDISIPRNTVIDEAMLQTVKEENISSIEVRSPLTCKSSKGICRKCYGWHLSKREEPQRGFAVGIMSAELIGERATQDAMRTYHKGTATGTIKRFHETKAIFDKSKNFKTSKKISDEVRDFHDIFNLACILFENYEKKVNIKHYEVILKSLMLDGEYRGTKAVISNKGFLYSASFERAIEVFKENASIQKKCSAHNALEKMFA